MPRARPNGVPDRPHRKVTAVLLGFAVALIREGVHPLRAGLRAAMMHEQQRLMREARDLPLVRAELLDDVGVPVRHRALLPRVPTGSTLPEDARNGAPV